MSALFRVKKRRPKANLAASKAKRKKFTPSAPGDEDSEGQASYQAQQAAYNAQKSALQSQLTALQQLQNEQAQLEAKISQLDAQIA